MNHPKLKIVFMGTPDFAVPALSALHASGHRVVLAVTQPDRPKGRGRKPAPTPVKAAAAGFGYPVVQPQSIRDEAFVEQLQALSPDLFVVVALGQILSRTLLDIPPMGTINIHASLLPLYRGPAPIQWALINDEKKTGVTTMLMDTGLDTGDILMTAETPVTREDTSATLHDRLSQLGADLLIPTITGLGDGTIEPKPQDHARSTYAPLLKKSDGRIDWRRPSESLEAFIRGMTPWPGAFTFWGERRLKIFRAAAKTAAVKEPAGTVRKTFPDELQVATGRGVLNILEIQGASGKRLKIREFLHGCSIPPGAIFS